MSRPMPPMAGPGLPPPPGGPVGEFGGMPQAPMPAPAQPPAPSAMADLMAVKQITQSLSTLAESHPVAVPIIQQIIPLIQELQMSLVQTAPPTEVAAPPV